MKEHNRRIAESKLIDRETREARNGKALNGSSDLSDWRSCSPVAQSRRSSSQLATTGSSPHSMDSYNIPKPRRLKYPEIKSFFLIGKNGYGKGRARISCDKFSIKMIST